MHSEATRKRPNGIDIDSVINLPTIENSRKRKKSPENGRLTLHSHQVDINNLTQNGSVTSEIDSHTVPRDPSEDKTNDRWDDKETFEDLNKEFMERNQDRASAGIIEKVFLMNFMCHRSFEVILGPNVNILQGPNGSGKSAVIAAIQVALGSKALSTERGHSLSELVLQGADYALIRLRIKNKSPAQQQELYDNRYRPDLFKDAIVIQRKIFRNGGSEWSLFDAENRKMEGLNPRQEVEKLLRHFNIYVENPATIVPQQRWKELLQLKKGDDLYGFFLEATGLRNYERNLMESESKRKQSEVAIQQKLEMVPSLEKKVKFLEQERGAIQNLDQFKQDLNDLEKEYAWRLVLQAEKQVDDKRREQYEKENLLDTKKEAVKQLDNQIDSLKAQVQEKEGFINEVAERMEAIRERRKEVDSAQRQKQVTKDSRGAELTVCKAALQKIKDSINELKERHRQLSENDSSELQQTISIENEVNSLVRERDSLDEDYKNSCHIIERKTEALEKLENELERMNLSIQTLKQEATEAEHAVAKWQRASRGNVCERFGVDEAFKRNIDRCVAAGMFHRPPIGPIGSYIKVKNVKWARAIQECIGRNILGKFIVSDHHDRKLLASLGGNVSVVVVTFNNSRYTLRNSDLHNYRTMIDELLVTDALVYNTLLDLCELDMNLLFDSLHECIVVAQQKLPNVKCCWSVEGKRVFMRNGGLFHRGYLSNDPILLTEDFGRAEKDAAARYKNLKEKIQLNIKQAKEAQKTQLNLRQDIDRAIERRRCTLEQKRNVERKIAEKQQEREDLETMRDNDTITERLATLMAEKEEKEQQIVLIEGTIDELNNELSTLTEQMNELRNEVHRLTQNYDDIYKFMQDKKEECEGLYRKKAELQREVEQNYSYIEMIASEVVTLENELQTKRNETQEKYGPPLTEWKYSSLEAVENAITYLTEQIKVMNERSPGRTLVQIVQELNECKTKLEKTNRQLSHLHTVVKRISDNIANWRKSYSKMHKRVERTIQLYFALFMSHRGHKGELHIDRKRRTVSIKVSVASQRKSNGTYILTEDLKSLSGGERSYTTLSFMLALGEALQVPFRIFDEFDVFMDEGNRHTAYQIIFDEAKSQRNRQFIFLTPLHLPSVICNSNDLRFITLQPPSRNRWMNMEQQILDENEYS
ncbi:DNA repair protein SMC6 [Galdieria sulphuraria]|uniref:DNA repair protein SMC6 n=1 Tax=Galdieria sulphuraria TaxID=130081 RepID=M2XK32_GALSU|nr:DNA repair protein SMC6 [Galdieria sulphuraria]EME30487.1 DNA repair protein SMC6 [Galdieria sulphuraria]|eukprot:XP_005707007.1 DNA repair protein SMC6 [Galdieria sulphuraria]